MTQETQKELLALVELFSDEVLKKTKGAPQWTLATLGMFNDTLIAKLGMDENKIWDILYEGHKNLNAQQGDYKI